MKARRTTMRMRRGSSLALPGACLALLAGCRVLGGGSCHDPQIYEQAESLAPLQIPEGLDGPDTRNALRIPELTEPPPPEPARDDPCLDAPPRYYSTPLPGSREAREAEQKAPPPGQN